MITNVASLSSRDKQHADVNECFDAIDSEYTNINLNHTCIDVYPVQSKSAEFGDSGSDKNVLDYNDSNRSKGKNYNDLWKNAPDNGFSDYLMDANSSENDSYNWKKKNNYSKTANSTLSLHIAAYENTIEDSNFDETVKLGGNTTKKHDNFRLGKTWKTVKQLFADSTSNLENPVAIPRQHQQLLPGVMKFKASQNLLDPKKLNLEKEKSMCKNNMYNLPISQRKNLNGLQAQNSHNKAISMNSIVDRFKCGVKNVDHEADKEPRRFPDCKISITNLLENGAFLITDTELHYELINKGWYGSRYEAQFNIELDGRIVLKGEYVWALTPEELVYLACERQIFEVTYRLPSGIESYTRDELYVEIMGRKLTDVYRLNVYRKLRTLGFVARSDNNYGGLFTIYEGNPAKYHALAIVYHEKDEILEYAAFLRVGNTVSKAVLVPSLITTPDSIGENYCDLSNVKVYYTLYDMERPEGLALAFN